MELKKIASDVAGTLHDEANKIKEDSLVDKGLNNFVTLPAGGFVVGEILGRVGLLGISVLAHVWIGVLLLVEVTEGVVDLSVLALICTDWGKVSWKCFHVLS